MNNVLMIFKLEEDLDGNDVFMLYSAVASSFILIRSEASKTMARTTWQIEPAITARSPHHIRIKYEMPRPISHGCLPNQLKVFTQFGGHSCWSRADGSSEEAPKFLLWDCIEGLLANKIRAIIVLSHSINVLFYLPTLALVITSFFDSCGGKLHTTTT